MTQAYPLHWPEGHKRRPARDRHRAQFGQKRGYSKAPLTIAVALTRLSDELDRLGADLPVVSANLERRADGLPRSNQSEPADPGIAVYFQLRGRPMCLPCDTFDRAADNIAAIAAHIEATRKIERYGVASVAQMFAGFERLPPPGALKPWRDVMGLSNGASLADAEAAFRRLSKERHPDKPGGSHDAMAELTAAMERARKELR